MVTSSGTQVYIHLLITVNMYSIYFSIVNSQIFYIKPISKNKKYVAAIINIVPFVCVVVDV